MHLESSGMPSSGTSLLFVFLNMSLMSFSKPHFLSYQEVIEVNLGYLLYKCFSSSS